MFFRPVAVCSPQAGETQPGEFHRAQLEAADAAVLYYAPDGGASTWNEMCAKSFLADGRAVIFVSDTSGRAPGRAPPSYSEMAAFIGREPLFVDLAEGRNALRRVIATASGRPFEQLKGRLAAQSARQAAGVLGGIFAGLALALGGLALVGISALLVLSLAFSNDIDPRPDEALAEAMCSETEAMTAQASNAEAVDRGAADNLVRAVKGMSDVCTRRP